MSLFEFPSCHIVRGVVNLNPLGIILSRNLLYTLDSRTISLAWGGDIQSRVLTMNIIKKIEDLAKVTSVRTGMQIFQSQMSGM